MMENIIKVFKLDMITVKKSSKMYILFAIISIAFLLLVNSTFGVSYLFLVVVIITTAPFTTESNTSLNKFTHSLPIKKFELVGGRYMFLLSALLAAWFIGTVGVATQYFRGNFTQGNVMQCILAAALLSFATTIQFPLYYKFGIQKGRMLSMLIYLVPVFLSFTLPEILVNITSEQSIEPNILSIIIISLVFLAICMTVSYNISRRIVQAKEL